MIRLLEGDCRTLLPTLPADSVHCVVTSPPYWGLRQYLFDQALVLRSDLSHEERAQVEAELAKRGIVPRQRGLVP
jgi:DNA modification methylase